MICINSHHYKCKTAIILGLVAVSQELKPSQNEEESLDAGYATLPRDSTWLKDVDFLGGKEYDADPTMRKQILFQKSSSKMAMAKELQLGRAAEQTELFRKAVETMGRSSWGAEVGEAQEMSFFKWLKWISGWVRGSVGGFEGVREGKERGVV